MARALGQIDTRKDEAILDAASRLFASRGLSVSMDEIARAFEYLTFLEVKPAAEMPGKPIGESRFDLADGLSLRVAPSLDEGNVWIRLRAEGGEEAQRLNARWGAWAYQVGVWKLKAFAPLAGDLKPQEPAAPAKP